jgi:hypothetical protein
MPVRSPGLRVAYECDEDWSRFAGEGATRLCDRCVKQVHDLSALTRREATELLRRHDGRICVRFTHDGEGRVLFRSERDRRRLIWRRFVPPGSS